MRHCRIMLHIISRSTRGRAAPHPEQRRALTALPAPIHGGRVLAIPFSSSAEVCPVRFVRAWLDAASVSEGPIFRAVNRHGRVGAARLSDRAVALVVQRAAASIGLDAATFAGHSLRGGFATSAARAGKADRDIMRQTGHRSRAMLDRYVRATQLWIDNPAAGLL